MPRKSTIANPPSLYTQARHFQREYTKLKKRFLRSGSIEYKQRDAANYANACGWNNPDTGADAAGKERWAERWLRHYADELARLG
jgi:hypothetical protein